MRRIWLLFVLALSACAPSVTQPRPVYKATAQELIAYLMADAEQEIAIAHTRLSG